mmetsp:Transcript_27660/g.69312  ORF Transcript_27660/g.69312 Transcript_27660/m.69312 type:complete len:304 (-) Transcript_27660:830-1741(-)
MKCAHVPAETVARVPANTQKSAGCEASKPLGMFIPAKDAGTAVTVRASVIMVACRFRRTVRFLVPSRNSSQTSRVASTCCDISDSCPPAARMRHRWICNRPTTAARRARSGGSESSSSSWLPSPPPTYPTCPPFVPSLCPPLLLPLGSVALSSHPAAKERPPPMPPVSPLLLLPLPPLLSKIPWPPPLPSLPSLLLLLSSPPPCARDCAPAADAGASGAAEYASLEQRGRRVSTRSSLRIASERAWCASRMSLSSSAIARRRGSRRWNPASLAPGPHPGLFSSSVIVSRQYSVRSLMRRSFWW